VGCQQNGHGWAGWMGVLAVPWFFPLGCWLARSGFVYCIRTWYDMVGLLVAIMCGVDVCVSLFKGRSEVVMTTTSEGTETSFGRKI
jgi:hypothetical protein